MAHITGKNGAVYTAPQLLEDCEDAWDTDGGATATSAAVSTDAKVGDYSVKIVCGLGVNTGDILAHEAITSVDIETPAYTHLMYWAKCTDAFTAAGDMEIGVSETEHLGGSPVYSDIPKLSAATWTYCISTITVTGLNAVISVGAKLTANDPGAFDLYLDDIRAAKAIAGIRAWSLDYTFEVVNTTDFADSGVSTFLPGISNWSGTFEGIKDGVPISIGTQINVNLSESATLTQAWRGNAAITGVHPAVSYDGEVAYSYDFQGTGTLMVPTA